MGTCFVIQPFDEGRFDKRYDAVFDPAIRAAGLKPYRVDRDPEASIPINYIEDGINRSELCLAEITTDNPNVWFELGYAIAVKKEAVLVCSDERKSKFPFDVQHRLIINYKTESTQDFEELKGKIEERIKAIIEKNREIDSVVKFSSVADTEGLLPHELVALVTIMQNQLTCKGGVLTYRIIEDMNNAGFTSIAVSLALKSLETKNLVSQDMEVDQFQNSFLTNIIK